MPQITFTIKDEDLQLISFIDNLAGKDNRSRSSMIVLLLHQAAKEKIRKKNAKTVHIQDNSSDKC